jgi:hypothetical protein
MFLPMIRFHNMNKGFLEHIEPKGIVERRLFSGYKLKSLLEKKTGVNFDEAYEVNANGVRVINFQALCLMALDVISKDELKSLIEKSVKKQFNWNFIGKYLYKVFGHDVVIPFVTGHYTAKAIKANLIVTTGHAGYAGQIGGVTSAAFTAMAYGTGSTAAAASDTTLGTEVTRGAATVTRVTTSVTNDTSQWVKTFTAGGTQAITEEGLLDNNSSGGNLLARNVHSAVNMILNDTLQYTHKITS